MFFEESFQIRAADFLLAFYEQDQVDRQITSFLESRFNTEDVR